MSRFVKNTSRRMNSPQQCSRQGSIRSAPAIARRTGLKRTIRWAASPLAAVVAGLALAASPAAAQAAKPAGSLPPVAAWIGARSDPWTTGNATIGPLKTQRLFLPFGASRQLSR
jgi:hypothetical protein